MRHVTLTAVAVLSGVATVSVVGAAPGTAAVRPGSGTVSVAGLTDVSSVWCGSAGSCAAAGDYPTNPGNGAFVARQKHGTWGMAIEVPGLAALNRGASVLGVSVSCGSAGNCAVGGDYTDRFGDLQGFAASEKHGVWGKAINRPGRPERGRVRRGYLGVVCTNGLLRGRRELR